MQQSLCLKISISPTKLFKRPEIMACGTTGKIIKITFKELSQVLPLIEIPDIQSDLQEDKIKEMMEAYLANPGHFITKCMLVIVEFTICDETAYYLIDGQHRAHMCKRLHKLGHNEVVLISLIKVSSKAEFNKLFEELNKDSYKCSYPRLSIFEKEQYETFKKALKERLKSFAPKCSSEQNRLYSISEFTSKIIHFVTSITTLFEKEVEFYNHVSYLEHSTEAKTKDCKFSITEIKSITSRSCMLMKRNNFIEWLQNSAIVPEHKFIIRKKISASLKRAVWKKYFNNDTEGQCQYASCTNKLRLDVINSWHCGHIVSIYNGGTNDLNNIKPICPDCNLAMSSNNWT
jgi:5-methylcytosine-specific restriction endonuclease McrA